MKFNHAIVLGGGFAGMLATHVLSEYFAQVTLIDRDELNTNEARKGIPQAAHLHVLMQQGQQLLNKLMPGILTEGSSLRGPQVSMQTIDWAQDTKWYGPFGVYPQYQSNIKTLSFSRMYLDRFMAKRISTLNNVTLITGYVLNLQAEFNRINSVKFADALQQTHTFKGDLIIDARGRGSNASEWLTKLGYTVPPAQIVQNDLGYASCIYKPKTKCTQTFKQLYLQVRPGINTKGVVISPIENDRLMVTALGLGKDKPPRQENHFQQYLMHLPGSELQLFLAALEPVSPVQIYRNLRNCHYRFGQMKKWPSGFIAIGDAVCILNPVYGQGMTLAAKQVQLLKSKLETLKFKNKKNWEHAFQKEADKITRLPWLIATAEDQRALTKLKRPIYLRLLHRYMDAILQLATYHQKTHTLFLQVLHMMKSPLLLFHPKVLMRIFFYAKLKRKNIT